MSNSDHDRHTSELRQALRKAAPIEPTVLSGEIVERVDVKHVVASLIEGSFQARTKSDGTVLNVSKECLIEELTEEIFRLVNASEKPLIGGNTSREERN